MSNDEGYELSVSKEQISLKGKTEAGVFYGIQTLHKALPVTDGTTLAAVPCGSVKDYPRFGYRGFMVDVGRHFFSVDYLKEIIDMLALHNINYFHWHLTEDQGWRIEIKKYPKLTSVGSIRPCKRILYSGRSERNCQICRRTVYYRYSGNRYAGPHAGCFGILSGTGMYGWSL